MEKKGYLILENGSVIDGTSFGSERDVSGEVVFNTGMVGYPESFTDPSYYGQILTMTYPLIGNYGVPASSHNDALPKVFESSKIHIRALLVSSYIEANSHWQSQQTLSHWLKEEGIPALSGIDTRAITQIMRETGVMKGAITFKKSRPKASGFSFIDINKDNLVTQVSCTKPRVYGSGKLRILLLDCGVKLNLIRVLLASNATIIQVPWNYNPFTNSSKLNFDALVISNGPGDPKMVKETVAMVKEAMRRKIPILGVCLGNQILALASGANTYKLKYGHRGQNQPVRDETTKKCYITTQNHGFAIDTKTLVNGWQSWFTNLNDGTNEGIRHTSLPFFSTQFHPEDMPGPTDTRWIFDEFITKAGLWKKKH